jgi:hypothetical protein
MIACKKVKGIIFWYSSVPWALPGDQTLFARLIFFQKSKNSHQKLLKIKNRQKKSFLDQKLQTIAFFQIIMDRHMSEFSKSYPHLVTSTWVCAPELQNANS